MVVVVVSHDIEYGAIVSSTPMGVVPSKKNCIAATPMLSDAPAVTATVPDTVAPPAGDVIASVGGVVSWAGSDVTSKASMTTRVSVELAFLVPSVRLPGSKNCLMKVLEKSGTSLVESGTTWWTGTGAFARGPEPIGGPRCDAGRISDLALCKARGIHG